MHPELSCTLYPLGDAAVCIDFGNRIDRRINDHVLALFRHLQAHPLKGITAIVPAYSSLTLFYDPAAWLAEIKKGVPVSGLLREQLELLAGDRYVLQVAEPRKIRVPVCYEDAYAPDLTDMAKIAGLRREDVIARHTAPLYHVYMLGFLPGFAYMGEVDEVIAFPRKQRPESILAGSVGIAGRQTGIYPLASPGGWQIIGRTPLSLFSAVTEETLLQPGDQVQFYSISSYEFEHY